MNRFDDLRGALRHQAGVEVYEQAAAANGQHGAGWHAATAGVDEAVREFLPGTRTVAYYAAKTANAMSGDDPNEWR